MICVPFFQTPKHWLVQSYACLSLHRSSFQIGEFIFKMRFFLTLKLDLELKTAPSKDRLSGIICLSFFIVSKLNYQYKISDFHTTSVLANRNFTSTHDFLQ